MTTTLATRRPASVRVALALIVWLAGSMLDAGVLLALQQMIALEPEGLSLVMPAPAVGEAADWPLIRDREPWGTRKVSSPGLARSLVLALAVVAAYFVVVSVARGSAPTVPAQVGGVLLRGLQCWLSRQLSAALTGALFGPWHV